MYEKFNIIFLVGMANILKKKQKNNKKKKKKNESQEK